MRCTLILIATLPFFYLRAGAASAPSIPTGTITGQIVDRYDRPVPYGIVLIRGTQLGGTANKDGVFRIIKVPVGTYSLVTPRSGFDADSQSVTLRANSTVVVNFVICALDIVHDSQTRKHVYTTSPDSVLGIAIRSVRGGRLSQDGDGWPPPIEAVFRNDGPDTLVLVGLDGRGFGTPARWQAWDDAGKPVPRASRDFVRAGVRSLQASDVFTLPPGQKYTTTVDFPADKFSFGSGRYRLALMYENNPDVSFLGVLDRPNDADAVWRLRGSTPCKLVSNVIEIEIK